MAQSGYRPTQDEEIPKNMPVERARQGQNIKGMIWVLGLGIASVVAAYFVMLTLSAQSAPPDDRPVAEQGDTAVVQPAPAETMIPPQ